MAASVSSTPTFGAPSTTGSSHATNSIVAYQGRGVNLLVPAHQPLPGTWQIQRNSDSSFFSNCPDSALNEAYNLMQGVIAKWQSKGINAYFIHAKDVVGQPMTIDLIPYPEGGFATMQQLKVLWQLTFGSANTSLEEMQTQAASAPTFTAPEEITDVTDAEGYVELAVGGDPSTDAFCNQEVIGRQRVFEGVLTNTLYDYKPLEYYHFLVVPKRHLEVFSALNREEFLESMRTLQRLKAVYTEKGFPIAHLMISNGARSGQTVPHLHMKFVFSESDKAEFWGKCGVFKKMTFGTSALPPEEVARRVREIQGDLGIAPNETSE